MIFNIFYNIWNGYYNGEIRTTYNKKIADIECLTNSWYAILVKMQTILENIYNEKKNPLHNRLEALRNLEIFKRDIAKINVECESTFNEHKGNYVSIMITGDI